MDRIGHFASSLRGGGPGGGLVGKGAVVKEKEKHCPNLDAY